MVSDNKEEEQYKQQKHSPKGPTPLSTPISCEGNLCTTSSREENLHALASPGMNLPTPNGIPTNQEEENLSTESPQVDLLWWHYRLGRCSFTWLSLLAALGVLPRKFLKVNPPKCDDGLYGAMTKRSWRTKSSSNRGTNRTYFTPVECV